MSKNKSRAAGMTTITFSLAEESKESLQNRVQKIQAVRNPTFNLSDLCRLAITYQEKLGWKPIPEANISS
jgi:hypothetical protein